MEFIVQARRNVKLLVLILQMLISISPVTFYVNATCGPLLQGGLMILHVAVMFVSLTVF